MSLPYPPALAKLLAPAGETNRSLVWDRGVDVYTIPWPDQPPKGDKGKRDALGKFLKRFQAPKDLAAFLARRDAALKALGASVVHATSATRLVVGLGLPHPFDTGFLFDRLTGCPYLPGSSVKGMLRAAAREVARGELAGDREFWTTRLDDLLGPATAGGAGAAKGRAAFYDAFPAAWPGLEIDVLTPHYRSYYERGATPGDWEDPDPIPFVTVKAATPFRFYFRLAPEVRDDEATQAVAKLFATALDWLGIGGKRAAGYGVFKPEPGKDEEKPARQGKAFVLRSTRVR